jgi:hypothetical protein
MLWNPNCRQIVMAAAQEKQAKPEHLQVSAPFQPSTLHSTDFLYIIHVFRVSLSI